MPIITTDKTKAEIGLRPRASSMTVPSSPKIHSSREPACGKRKSGSALVVTVALVATLTVTDCEPVPLIGIDDGTLQVGVGITDGVIAQLKWTVPVNVPTGVRARLKLAVWPAVIV